LTSQGTSLTGEEGPARISKLPGFCWSATRGGRHFFAHLSIEKALKALVVKATRDLAPLSHNLVLLAEKTGLEFQEPDRVFLLT
jgi:hypothetical protein